MSRLEEIEARAQAATAGPWVWKDHTEPWMWKSGNLIAPSVCDPWLGDGTEPTDIIVTDGGHYPPRDGDRPFIAHARDDIPWLLAEVRRLQVLVAEH